MGCDVAIRISLVSEYMFQSTHPCGVRLSSKVLSGYARQCFNPRTPVGCDLPWGKLPHWRLQGFNPRTPVGCDVTCMSRSEGHRAFQSTHPCGVRPYQWDAIFERKLVSIHAPLWGATPADTVFRTGYSGFNPRTPVGCDATIQITARDVIGVSIHAPLWGATND